MPKNYSIAGYKKIEGPDEYKVGNILDNQWVKDGTSAQMAQGGRLGMFQQDDYEEGGIAYTVYYFHMVGGALVVWLQTKGQPEYRAYRFAFRKL